MSRSPSIRRLAPLVLGALLLSPLACAKDRGSSAELPHSLPSEPAPPVEAGKAEAIFAGGCFWCMEKPFDKVEGVLSTTSGYTDGYIDKPEYYDVSSGGTGHTEALRVVYDPDKVSYERLLEVFWHNIDPTQANGQFCDRGTQYRTGVYFKTSEEKALAQSSKNAVATELKKPVETEIRPASTFWVAEAYHQDFYLRETAHYERYRLGCGRDARLRELWGDKAGH